MKFLDTKAIDFLEKYINNCSPVGFEKDGQRLWMDYMEPYADKFLEGAYGSLIAVINPEAEYRVVIEAHADEIAWYVNYIDKNGFIYLLRNGGSDPVIAPSKRVKIHTNKGEVDAVFGWTAVQMRAKAGNPKPELDNIFLDCGCSSKKEVEELGVQVGDIVTFTDEFKILNKNFFIGRALDNRAGGVIIAQVARLLKENEIKLPFGLYIVNSVQEEVGKNGAAMVAEKLQPDLAIITDVTHDTSTPKLDKRTFGDYRCGKGPILTIAPPIHNKLLGMLRKTAGENGIQYQLKPAEKKTGTDVDAFAFANGGIVSALVSLPMRYMHTTVEMVHRKDMESCISLLYHFLAGFKPETSFKHIVK